ncbi:MAG: zinc-binding dehydrogenase [Saprospirales bacterium]|nr:zinc-binding dehydrogenase [Saprospirales bacterium]
MKRTSYFLRAGNIKNLQPIEQDLPDPAEQEVTVAIKTIGLNYADIFAITGLYSATPKEAFTPGLEYAGEILKVGKGVTRWKPGDKVMGVTRFGAYTTHLNIDQRYVTPIPPSWDFDQGAAYLVQVLTAYYALFNLGNLQEGQNVLIHSAAGGVGILANRIAKKKGAFTIGTVGSPAKVDFCKEEGYDRVIVRGKDFKEKLVEALGDRPLNLILDPIGGKILKAGYDLLTPQGRLVVYGSARYGFRGNRPPILSLVWKFLTRPKIDPQAMTSDNKSVMGFNLIYLFEHADIMHQILADLERMELKPPHVGHTYSFDQLPEAIRFFQKGENVGKIVVRV